MAKVDPRQKQPAAKKPSEIAASVSRPVKPARMPKASAAPLTSRTATLDDPLTTSLLAEIARRPTTLEVTPEQIAEAMAAADADQAPERDPEE